MVITSPITYTLNLNPTTVNMDIQLSAIFLAAILTIGYGQILNVGGLKEVGVNDGDVHIMALFAVSEIGTEYALVEVTKARTQVVAGTLYHLTMMVNRVSQTDNSSKNYSCKVKVLSQEWKADLTLNQFHCQHAA